MKIIIFLLICICLNISKAFGQISIIENERKNSFQTIEYDSLSNIYPIDNSFKHLIGQELFFYGDSANIAISEKYDLGIYSEQAWDKYLKIIKSHKYKTIEKIPINTVFKKAFNILDFDIISLNSQRNNTPTHFIKLKDKENGTIFYLRFNHTDINPYATIIGYIEKAKKMYLNKVFILDSDYNPFYPNWLKYKDTDELATDLKRSRWKCVDISLKSINRGVHPLVTLVLRNENQWYNDCYIFLDALPNGYNKNKFLGIFTPAETIEKEIKEKAIQDSIRLASLIKKYGRDKAYDIFRGNIHLGFTKEMCVEAWGAPSSKNITESNYGRYEQWIYKRKNCYLYFENDLLKTIQY